MREFILGTDWWTDCDDLAAMRILLRAHKKGEIKLLGVGINAVMKHSVSSVDGFISLEGLTDIPLGIDLQGDDFEGRHHKYQKTLSSYAVKFKDNGSAEDGVSLYRRLLSESEGKVEIVEIGFLQIFADLLLSGPDSFSDKNGIELVKEKVKKVWVMAGKWDEEGGKEHNFCNNQRSRRGGEIFCRLCPVEVTFLGFEAGVNVISGNELSHGDFLYRAFLEHGSEKGRCSWDPMTALLALTGDEKKAGYSFVQGRASLDEESGRNYFIPDENGLHKYVITDFPPEYYAEKINLLIN